MIKDSLIRRLQKFKKYILIKYFYPKIPKKKKKALQDKLYKTDKLFVCRTVTDSIYGKFPKLSTKKYLEAFKA